MTTENQTQWKLVPVEPDAEMVQILENTLVVTAKGSFLNAHAALSRVLAAAPQPPALGGEPIEPRYFYAECADPDYSCLCNNHGDALTAVADHGGTVTKLWNIDPNAHVARLQAAFEVVCNLAHARADELEQLRAEVERQSAERQTYVESTQRACKIIGQLRGLLREVLVYDKSQRLGDGFNLSGLLQRIDAALAGGKEHG